MNTIETLKGIIDYERESYEPETIAEDLKALDHAVKFLEKYHASVVFFIPGSTQDDRKDKLHETAVFSSFAAAEDYIRFYLNNLNEGANKGRFYLVKAEDFRKGGDLFENYKIISSYDDFKYLAIK